MYWKQVAAESSREKEDKQDEGEKRTQADQFDKLLGNGLQWVAGREGLRYWCSFKPRKAVRKRYLEMGLNRPGEGNKQREAKYTSNEDAQPLATDWPQQTKARANKTAVSLTHGEAGGVEWFYILSLKWEQDFQIETRVDGQESETGDELIKKTEQER